jgi:hypothetical protein
VSKRKQLAAAAGGMLLDGTQNIKVFLHLSKDAPTDP